KYLLLFSLASCCIVFNVQAQIRKGAVLLGGDIGANNQKSSVQDSVIYKQRSINAGFSYGKAIKENLILGGAVYWRNQRSVDWAVPDVTYNQNTWGLGVFMRKYKQLGASGFYVFAQGALSGEYMRQKATSVTDEGITNGWSAILAAYP